MSTIEILPEFEDWLDREVFSEFARTGILVTEPAKQLIAYVFQSQGVDSVSPPVLQVYNQLVSRIQTRGSAEGTFFGNALRIYLGLYPLSPPMNVNRAIRLLTEMYIASMGHFPCGPTEGGGGGKGSEGGTGSEGSGQGSQGSGRRTFYPQRTPSVG